MLHSKPTENLGPHSNAPRHHICFLGPGFSCFRSVVLCCVAWCGVCCSAARERHQTAGAVTKSLAVISSFSAFVSPLGFGRRSLSLRPCFTLWPRGSPLREARLAALCQRPKLARPPHNRPEILFLTFRHERRKEGERRKKKVAQLCSAPACVFNYDFKKK